MSKIRLLPLLALSAVLLVTAVPVSFGAQATTPGTGTAADGTVVGTTGDATAIPGRTAARHWADTEYRLGPGDKLRVEVYREPQLSQSLQVRPDGMITLPLVGDVPARGRTALELRDSLNSALKEYVTAPVVTVIVTDAIAARASIIGEVMKPGVFTMNGPMTVLQALAEAGGFKEFAKTKSIRILRRTPTGVKTIPFSYKRAIRSRSEPVYLEPGDTIVVP